MNWFGKIFALFLTVAFFSWSESNQTILAQEETDQVVSDHRLVEDLPYKYYGHCISHKFHRPSCPFGMCISKSHLVLFHFRKDAIDAHFKPCKYCLPPVWWSVHGVILPKLSEISPENSDEKNSTQSN